MAKSKKTEVKTNRRKEQDRRKGSERRKSDQPVATERRTAPRRKVQRRRQIDPTTCERDYSNDEIEFMHALDDYKRRSGRMFPTCSEILEVIRDMGYVKLSPEEIAARGPGNGPATVDEPEAEEPAAQNDA